MTSRGAELLRLRFERQTGSKPRNPEVLERWAAECEVEAAREAAELAVLAVGAAKPSWRSRLYVKGSAADDWRGERESLK